MRPYAWVKFPSATAAEVNALIKVRWNVLKKAPKTGKGCGVLGCGNFKVSDGVIFTKRFQLGHGGKY